VTRTLLLVLAALAMARPTLASFDSELDTPALRGIDQALAASVAKALPIPAASAGITFRFDPATSAFEREIDIVGQVFVERARPIGRGHLNLSVVYQHIDTDLIDGKDLSSLSDVRPMYLPRQKDDPFVIPHFKLSLVTNAVIPSLSYGVTDDLEVNLTVPVLYSSLDASGVLRRLSGVSPVQRGITTDTALGVGDVFLRSKYRLVRGWLGEVAAGLVFRLPSGDEGNFQGTGLFEVDPRLYASTPAVTLAPHVRVQAHVNAGLDLTPQDGSRGEGRWAVGFDCMFDSYGTLSLALLGREPFSRLLPPGAGDIPRVGGPPAPVFGIDPGHPSYYDLSIGGRVNLWRDTVFGILDVVVPVNPDGGVRASVVPVIGLEAVF